jgi:purine-nucleoside phosphorylase
MVFKHLLEENAKFGATPSDIVRLHFSCNPDEIDENVIIAPSWHPQIFPNFTENMVQIFDNQHIKIWNISIDNKKITYFVTGAGAPKVIETVLALGCTPCKKIIFIGSVGGLSKEFKIGDIIIPEYSICGDGSCRYLTNGNIAENDCFGEKYYPNKELYNQIILKTKEITKESNVNWHIGKNFSIDTIIAQFAHIGEIQEMGCNCVEMETAVLFKASEICSIKAGAVFSISDNSIIKKSLASGRTKEEMEYREKVRDKILTKIVMECI